MDDKEYVCLRIWFSPDIELDGDIRMANLLHENYQTYYKVDEYAFALVDKMLTDPNSDPFSLHYDYAQRVLMHIHYPDEFTDELWTVKGD